MSNGMRAIPDKNACNGSAAIPSMASTAVLPDEVVKIVLRDLDDRSISR